MRRLCSSHALALVLSSLAILFAAPALASPIIQLQTFQDTPDPVAATATLVYTLQVSNTSFVSSATGVVLTVPIPAGTSFISVDDPACTFSAPNVVCSFGTVAPSTDLIVNITMRVTAAGGATINDTATVTSTTLGETPSSLSQATTVTAGADLQLSKSGSPNPVVAGALVTYTLTTTNLGPNDSSGVTVVDNLPPSVTYVSSSGTGWSCTPSGSTVNCSKTGTIVNGATSTLTIVGRVQNSIAGSITNSATVSASTPDGLPSNNTATATVSVNPGADLSISKTAAPTPMIAANAVTFTLRPRNAGPDAAASVSVTDTLPAGFTGIGASGTNYSCNVVALTRTVTCTRASLPVGASDDITITATAPDNSFVPAGGLATSNSASVSATTSDPDASNNTGNVGFTIQRDGADLSVQKTKTPNPVAQGSPMTSTMRAINNGPRALTSSETIVLSDTLPTGEDYGGASPFSVNGWTCTYNGGTRVVACTRLGPLAVGAATPDVVFVTTATSAASLTNNACAAISGGSITDPNGGNDCASATANSTAAIADLGIVKSQSLTTVTTSDNVLTYTLTISNNGPQDSTGIVVRDVIPMYTALAGGTVINAVAGTGSKGSTGACSVSTATVTCNYANLLYASGAPLNTAETATITITVTRPMADGSFTNTATITSTNIGDPNSANNSSSVATTVDPVADLQLQSKTVTPNPVQAGVDATYVITFRNNGPSPSLNVVVTDTFAPAGGDAGYSMRSVTPSKGSCGALSGNVLTCSIGTLNASETQTITVVVRPLWMASPPVGRNLPNTAVISSATTFDPVAGNNSQSATLNINPASIDLIANKTDVPSFSGVLADPVAYDGTAPSSNIITYRVTFNNVGPSEATSISFTDTITPPSGKSLSFVCDSASQFACTGTPVCTASGATTVTGPTTQIVNCSAGSPASLDAGSSYVRYLRYQVNSAPAATGDTYSNNVVVSADETDSNGGNNSATEPTVVRAKADLQVTSKTAIVAAPPLQYGVPFQWQIKVMNNGPGDAYLSTLSDTLPTNMELVAPFAYTVTPGAGTCSNTGVTAFACALGTLTPGSGDEQTVTVDVVIRRPVSGPYPSSYTNTASVTTSSVDTVSGNNSNSGSVSLVKSSIAGRVYKDLNNNGAIDGGETGIAGVALALSGTDVNGISVSRSATSDGSGNYIFDDLEQSNGSGYTITETQPSGYSDGLETIGTAASGAAPGGSKSNTVGSNTITTIVLDKNQAATGYLFGELPLNTLSGTVFADINNDGTKQAGEPGIAGVTITLTGTDARGAAVSTTATTNASGNYSFANVLPGSYTLTETQPTLYVDGIDSVGSLGGSAAVNDVLSGIVVGANNGTAYNFAERPGTISGQVWRDVNRNGAIDGGEAGIASVTISLSGTDALGGAVSRSTTTNGSGNYSFADLPQGTYTVTEAQPAGFGSSTPNSISSITIPAGGTSSGNNFGDTTSSISGNIFFDRNADGTKNGSDSNIAGVTVTLTGTSAAGGAVSITTTSDASGNYSFLDLLAPNGSGYTVTETQPSAYSNGQVTAGSAGGTVNQPLNRVSAIALTVGSDATGYNYAELGTPISGVVFRDTNVNGVQDGPEVGLPGVTIELLDSFATVIASTTTAADGSYSFPVQPGGVYTVREPTQPAGFGSSTPNSVPITLVAGTPGVVNFGESTGSLAGRVFLDSNNNGVIDGGEIGLPGVTVTLTGNDVNGLAVSRTTTTNGTGNYSFNDLLAANGAGYALTETQPAVFADGIDALGAGNVGGIPGNDVYTAIPLVAAANGTGYNFGERGSAIVGVVFKDANRNSVQEAGDNGLNGVTITLLDSVSAVVATTTTAPDGSYFFAGIPSGNYTVVETQPLGYGSSASSPNSVAVTVPPGGSASANFADTVSTLAGSVYVDLNNNGVRDAGEPGIASVNITLTGTDAAGNPVSRSAATDASGNYIFIDLLTPNGAGYSVAEPVQPAAYADGIDSAGSAGGSASNDLITAIMLPVNTDATGYRFGERGTAISGVVYKDVNGNGAQDGADPGIAGVLITLRDSFGALVATTTTAVDGSYSFTGLASGNYSVVETQPAGYGSSTPNTLSVIAIPGGGATANFGETTSSIAGSVYVDANNNGVRDAGPTPESGIAGVTVRLTGTNATSVAVNLLATTDASGNYIFSDLLSGTYTLTETQPALYADGTDAVGSAGGTVGNDVLSAIALPVGTAATGYVFGERGQSISGKVYSDLNRNAILEGSEPGINTVTITLKDSGTAVVATTTTATDGSYGFANIPAGNYTVEETQPAGYGSSTPNTVAVTVTTAGPAAPINFGETTGSLSGLVYNDSNNNGLRDVGEPPIASVTIQLTGTDARGNPVSLTTLTAADGRYQFVGLPSGMYTINETQPSAYGDGTDAIGSAGGTLGNDILSAINLPVTTDATGYNFGERGANAQVSGSIWRDLNHDRAKDAGETLVPGWIVELLQGPTLIQSTTTSASGGYQFINVAPGSGYEIRFRDPANNALYGKPVTNETGLAAAPGVIGPSNPAGADNRLGTLAGLTLPPGASVVQQSLPLDPTGVVYDSISRQPVAGATVTLTGPSGFDPALHLLGGSSNATQLTGTDGIYQFLLNPSAPAGQYSLTVTPPAGRYTPGPSSIIPACAAALNVGALPDPALVQTSDNAPAASIPNQSAAACPANTGGLAAGAATTQYFLAFIFTPGTSTNLINNHVPIDPILGGALSVVKTTPLVNVSRGDLVPYTIAVTNTLNATLSNVDVRDLLPPGFSFRKGSGTLNGLALQPVPAGRQLTWTNLTFAPKEKKTFKLILIVGTGVSEGEYINQAWGLNNLVGTTISNIASATVRIVPDPVFDCADIIGKVFDDKNVNGYQDEGEGGIPNVRLATVNGILVTTDAEGRFHIACAAIPNEYRGSNFVMKLDERTLPSGYRVTTENPRDVRVTRGKMVKLNFGATIHRVARIEISDAAFEAGREALKPEWQKQVEALPEMLKKQPSVVRIAYIKTPAALMSQDQAIETPDLIKQRKAFLIQQIKQGWTQLKDAYPLSIEDEAEGQ